MELAFHRIRSRETQAWTVRPSGRCGQSASPSSHGAAPPNASLRPLYSVPCMPPGPSCVCVCCLAPQHQRPWSRAGLRRLPAVPTKHSSNVGTEPGTSGTRQAEPSEGSRAIIGGLWARSEQRCRASPGSHLPAPRGAPLRLHPKRLILREEFGPLETGRQAGLCSPAGTSDPASEAQTGKQHPPRKTTYSGMEPLGPGTPAPGCAVPKAAHAADASAPPGASHRHGATSLPSRRPRPPSFPDFTGERVLAWETVG